MNLSLSINPSVFLTSVLVCLSAGCAMAAVIEVSPGQSIQAAVDRAKPGDTVLINGGIYTENVVVTASGTAERPIIIEGRAGAQIHGQMSWQPTWSDADFGEGVFRAPCPVEPELLCYDGKLVLKCTNNPKRVLTRGSETTESRVPGGFRHIKGVWAYMDGHVYVRTPDKRSPAGHDVRVGARLSACISLDGASNVTVRGLILKYATYGVLATNGRRLTIEYNTVGPTAHGIRFGEGVDDSVIRYCEVTCPAIFEWSSPQMQLPDGTSPMEDIYYINKPKGPKNRRSISVLSAGANNEIAYNHVHHCYQGVEAKEADRHDGRDYNRNLDVHHNYIHNVTFYGLSPHGTSVNGRWHHNLVVLASSAGVRFKQPSKGPVFFYRNVIVHHPEAGRPWWSDRPTRAPILMYHNTIYGGWTMIRLRYPDVPNFCLLANAFVHTPRAYRHGEFFGLVGPEQIDYNLISNPEMVLYERLTGAGYQAHGTVAPLPEGVDHEAVLAAGRDKGPDWETLVGQLRKKMPSLPAVLPGTEHIKGRGDIGAFEAGFTEAAHAVGVDPELCGAGATR